MQFNQQMQFNQEKMEEITREVLDAEEQNLSPFAAPNSRAERKVPAPDYLRSPYAKDRDRIIYSGAFRRYIGKTQVFYFANLFDEQISNRSNHAIQVSQIARTIGKMLRLNLDLIEAIALGHDLGHTPFGHDGEDFLSRLCIQHGIGEFHHNVQSLYVVDRIANGGKGLNLTLQVRDGILAHDGEAHNQHLTPQADKTEADLQKYCRERENGQKSQFFPMTLEGCTVRMADVIAYLGQDIEDAIRLGFTTREAIPEACAQGLGRSNGEIVDTLVKDVILTSWQNNFIAFSPEVSQLVKTLKDFNYHTIYLNSKVNQEKNKIKQAFALLFERFLTDIEEQNRDSFIYKHFLNSRREYQQAVTPPEMVRDFIATMTDRYFTALLEHLFIPTKTELKD